jgi:hypothetical protein
MRLARLFEARRLPGGRDLLLVVFALMFARGDGAFAVDEVPRPEPAIACPSQDFQEFLEIFVEDEAVQRAFTKTPLITLSFDFDAKPNPVRFIEELAYQKIKFPVFPSSQERAKRSLKFWISGLFDDRHAEVWISPENADSRISPAGKTSYLFSKDSCWRLVFVDSAYGTSSK